MKKGTQRSANFHHFSSASYRPVLAVEHEGVIRIGRMTQLQQDCLFYRALNESSFGSILCIGKKRGRKKKGRESLMYEYILFKDSRPTPDPLDFFP